MMMMLKMVLVMMLMLMLMMRMTMTSSTWLLLFIPSLGPISPGNEMSLVVLFATNMSYGSNLTDNHTGQRLMGARVPELQKTKSSFYENLNKSQPGQEKDELLCLGQG